MNALLERLGRFAGRHRWWVIGVWVLLLAGLTLANRTEGGDFVNDYTVPGQPVLVRPGRPAQGLQVRERLQRPDRLPRRQGQGRPTTSKAVATTMKNVGALPHVLSATDPLTAKGTPAVSKDGTIAYGSVSWDVVPASLDADYLD